VRAGRLILGGQAEIVGGVLWGRLADSIDYRFVLTVRFIVNVCVCR
jgi:hypothetical protein